MSAVCRKCGVPEDDWTLGCRTCTNRHYRRAVRSGDCILLGRYRATARDHHDYVVQENANRRRDGELVWPLPPRGYRGQWTRPEATA